MRKIVFLGNTLFLYLSCSSTKNLEVPPSRLKKSVATVVNEDVPRMHGDSYAVYTYTLSNGRIYMFQAGARAWTYNGEKFIVEYDSLEPSHMVQLHRESPVFLPIEETAFTIGTLIRTHANGGVFEFKYKPTINFTYEGKEYQEERIFEKVQALGHGNLVKKYPQLINGATFAVEYWKKDPRRAILYINYPVKDSLSFMPNERPTTYTTGTLVNLHKDYMFVSFIYNVGGKEYNGLQGLEKNVGSYPLLVNGAKFEVEFSEKNPQRAVISISHPINDSIK